MPPLGKLALGAASLQVLIDEVVKNNQGKPAAADGIHCNAFIDRRAGGDDDYEHSAEVAEVIGTRQRSCTRVGLRQDSPAGRHTVSGLGPR